MLENLANPVDVLLKSDKDVQDVSRHLQPQNVLTRFVFCLYTCNCGPNCVTICAVRYAGTPDVSDSEWRCSTVGIRKRNNIYYVKFYENEKGGRGGDTGRTKKTQG